MLRVTNNESSVPKPLHSAFGPQYRWTPTRENGSRLLPSRDEAELAKYRKSAEFALLDQQKKR
jgi:hypothetical protein